MRNKKYFLKKISNYAIVGGLGAILITNFTGCEDKSSNNDNQSNTLANATKQQGAFVIVEKTYQGGYKIVDEFPATRTTIVLRENGEERILSKSEIDKLVAQEKVKIDNGTSNLTNNSEVSSGGMSLGETLLASAAGAVIGSYIGNKLFNNSNYNTKRRTTYKSPSTYSRSVNSFNKARTSSTRKATTAKRTGFFGSSRKSSSRSFFGG